MINKIELKKIEDAINYSGCVHCGQVHHVDLLTEKVLQNRSHSSRYSSRVMSLFPTGDKVFIEFSDECCEEFKTRVLAYLQFCSSRIVDIPFDRIW